MTGVVRKDDVARGGDEVVCPHCSKPFRAELLARGSAQQGFKCPHCRLFVPLGRAEQTGSG